MDVSDKNRKIVVIVGAGEIDFLRCFPEKSH